MSREIGTFYFNTMKDIQTRDDLYLIVSSFYDKLLADEQINFIFTEVLTKFVNFHKLKAT